MSETITDGKTPIKGKMQFLPWTCSAFLYVASLKRHFHYEIDDVKQLIRSFFPNFSVFRQFLRFSATLNRHISVVFQRIFEIPTLSHHIWIIFFENDFRFSLRAL